MDIQNKRISDGEFARVREEVLMQWPTGKDVNLEEAVAYHKAMPQYRKFGDKLLAAKRDGRTLVQPRAGVPVVEEHIKLMQYLEEIGILGEMTSIDVTNLAAIEMWYGTRFRVLLGDTTNLQNKVFQVKGAIDKSGDTE